MLIFTVWILKYVQQCYVKWFWTISSLGAPEQILFFPRQTFRGQEDGPCILGNYFLKIKISVSFVFTQDHFLDADAVH